MKELCLCCVPRSASFLLSASCSGLRARRERQRKRVERSTEPHKHQRSTSRDTSHQRTLYAKQQHKPLCVAPKRSPSSSSSSPSYSFLFFFHLLLLHPVSFEPDYLCFLSELALSPPTPTPTATKIILLFDFFGLLLLLFTRHRFSLPWPP